jgi:ER membrane protein complex subunit 3
MPFPLGQKFKTMTQSGIYIADMDPSFVSSMSWCILLIYGLQGILTLMISDTKALEESIMASSGNAMMMQ